MASVFHKGVIKLDCQKPVVNIQSNISILIQPYHTLTVLL